MDQKESTAKEGEIKCGQLQFTICDNPMLALEGSRTTMLSELRQFRLTNHSFDCFKEDSQVHSMNANHVNCCPSHTLLVHCDSHTHIHTGGNGTQLLSLQCREG